VFLIANAHEDAPVLFQTRWPLSYPSGPLTGTQIARLKADRPQTEAAQPPAPVVRKNAPAPEPLTASRPTIPHGIAERFLRVMHPAIDEERLVYRPALGVAATLHYANIKARIDEWQDVAMLTPLDPSAASPWTTAVECNVPTLLFDPEPAMGAT
jgi:hypothetical protein